MEGMEKAARQISAHLCEHVAERTHPVLIVLHDVDGTWHLLCGGKHSSKPSGPAPLVDRDKIVGADSTLEQVLSDLPLGFAAQRKSPGDPWRQHQMPLHSTPAFVCNHVFDHSRPVLLVCHFDYGWQLLCGAGHAKGDGPRKVGLSHFIEHDPSLRQILDLPENHEAERVAPGAAWERRGPIQ